MSKNTVPAKPGTISTYFTRLSARESETGDIPTDSECGEISVRPEKMAPKKTNDEIHEVLLALSTTVKKGFIEVNVKLATLSEKIESVELDVQTIQTDQENDRKTIEILREEMTELKKSLLATQTYSRKYHLLLYGVEGQDTSPVDTIKRVRTFASENLKLGSEFAQNMTIRNAHRLQRRETGPAAIIVVFVYWAEREAFLGAGKNLKGTKMSVRTDLPPELKRKRGQLAHEAWQIRQNDNIQARVREKGPDVWVETRNHTGQPWKKIQ
jgi:hypothetical protein